MGMNNYTRKFFLMICDLLLVNLATVVPILTLLADNQMPVRYSGSQLIITTVVIFVIYLTFFNLFKLYNRDWVYAGMGELVAIIGAVTAGSAVILLLGPLGLQLLPIYLVLTQWALIIIFVGGSRLAWRLFIEHKKSLAGKSGRKTIIVGAGDAGVMVARELKGHDSYSPVGFIDDDPDKKHLIILGFPVLGAREEIPRVVKQFNVDLIIIAMPSVNSEAIREIIEICRTTRVEIKILPGIYQIINGNVSVSHLRLVQLEDLLHREAVQVDLKEVAGYLKGANVLITGAGGSIGSELCHQVSLYQPAKLILLGHGENSIHKIWLKLQEKFKDIPLAIEIADVRDKVKINYIFEKYRPRVVFHAAAHKHVPLMEMHPDEAVKTNVFGTLNVADAADRVGVKVFVMISTDKAVNPSSV
ncbi:MAG: polysaccharide biosynthesis protein, partial [Firmicutes bacterium]|nr:polysaccharide biosynthesis protein [Bacillota bacterium]